MVHNPLLPPLSFLLCRLLGLLLEFRELPLSGLAALPFFGCLSLYTKDLGLAPLFVPFSGGI